MIKIMNMKIIQMTKFKDYPKNYHPYNQGSMKYKYKSSPAASGSMINGNNGDGEDGNEYIKLLLAGLLVYKLRRPKIKNRHKNRYNKSKSKSNINNDNNNINFNN